MRLSPILLAAPLLCTGCIDFETPDLVEAGAPAVVEAAIHVQDSGRLNVTARLTPAITPDFAVRDFPDGDSIRVYGVAIPPERVHPNRTRDYRFDELLGPGVFTQLISFVAPRVSGVEAPPPSIIWPSPVRVGPDTLLLGAGEDLVVHVSMRGVPGTPPPEFAQWSLDLFTDSAYFRVSGNGLPPAEIRVPSFWIPVSPDRKLTASFTSHFSGRVRHPPGDYLLTLTADVRLRWIVLPK